MMTSNCSSDQARSKLPASRRNPWQSGTLTRKVIHCTLPQLLTVLTVQPGRPRTVQCHKAVMRYNISSQPVARTHNAYVPMSAGALCSGHSGACVGGHRISLVGCAVEGFRWGASRDEMRRPTAPSAGRHEHHHGPTCPVAHRPLPARLYEGWRGRISRGSLSPIMS